jgi:hypothetical protein
LQELPERGKRANTCAPMVRNCSESCAYATTESPVLAPFLVSGVDPTPVRELAASGAQSVSLKLAVAWETRPCLYRVLLCQ